MMRQYLVLWVAIAAALSFMAWRYAVGHASPPASHVVIVHDASRSSGAGCEAVKTAARSAFDLPGVGPGSTLALIATGESANSNHGHLLKIFRMPFNRRAIEGRDAARRERERMVAEVARACGAAQATDISPILSAIEDALAHLRAQGCIGSPVCYLLAETDGIENADQMLRLALAGSGRAAAQVRGILSNEGVRVRFCGFAQPSGSGGRGPAGARERRRAEQVWKSLFTVPVLVDVAPYCGLPGA